MSCYIRHLDEFFDVLSIENTKENRKCLDFAIKKELGMEEAHCPEVWKKMKEVLASEAETSALLDDLKKEFDN